MLVERDAPGGQAGTGANDDMTFRTRVAAGGLFCDNLESGGTEIDSLRLLAIPTSTAMR